MKYNSLFISVCLLFICFNKTQAQQQTRYSQFMWNEFAINPAFTGGLNYNPIQLSYRKQWQGFNGSPETFTFGGHSAINSKMGLGGMIFKDNMGGAISQTGLMLNYAYHLKLNEESRLSFGVGAIVNQFSFNNTKINPMDVTDPSFQGGLQKSTNLDASFGLLYKYKEKLKIGFSSLQLIQSKLKNLNTVPGSDSRLIRHYNLQLAYKFLVNEKFTIEPSILLKATEVSPIQMDVNLKSWYNNTIMVGLSYRYQDAVVALVGMKYKKMFIGYSYDLNTSIIKTYNTGSHEIVLGYHFSKEK
jgi:type IX secretion system PorP/SprF family membrane protein